MHEAGEPGSFGDVDKLKEVIRLLTLALDHCNRLLADAEEQKSLKSRQPDDG